MVELTSVNHKTTILWAVVHEDFILEMAGDDRNRRKELDDLLDEGPDACIDAEVSVIDDESEMDNELSDLTPRW
jgi:hypothetical protein